MQRRRSFQATPKQHPLKRVPPHNWCARGVRERAFCEPLQLQTADLTACLRSVCVTLRNDAIESTVRRRS
eukprot:11190413-Lingulodinium_polyedra.AAC.1